MAAKARSPQRREESLTRERIIEAAIELLDHSGEVGLTFRTLSERLATGPGAIYWHIADKEDLLVAACDAIVVRVMAAHVAGRSPQAVIRALALALLDAIHAHPWVGSALMRAAGQLPVVRILEGLGRPVRALRVPPAAEWSTVSALLHYILGVGGLNAANAHYARGGGLDRTSFLGGVAVAWSQLDPDTYPFTRSMAGPLGAHDDRADFLAGIDLILGGIRGKAPRRKK